MLVKSEQFLDRFDVLFGQYFKGIEQITPEIIAKVAESWLSSEYQREFTEEEKAAIEAAGGEVVLL